MKMEWMASDDILFVPSFYENLFSGWKDISQGINTQILNHQDGGSRFL